MAGTLFPDIAVVAASPHAGGTAAAVAAHLARGIAFAGASADALSLAGKRLAGCIHCGACANPPHACALEGSDDTGALLDRMAAADLLVWVSPVYFYGLPSQAKALVDRAQGRWEAARRAGDPAAAPLPEGKAPAPAAGKLRPARRTAAVLLAGRTGGGKLFLGSRLSLRYFFEALGRGLPVWRELRGLEGPGDITPSLAGELVAWGRDLARQLLEDDHAAHGGTLRP